MPVDVKKDDMGDVIAKLSSEGFKTDILTDRKYGKKMADQENKHRESDVRMKFGKFYDKAKEAKDRLRPGEVKKLVDGKWVSNKD